MADEAQLERHESGAGDGLRAEVPIILALVVVAVGVKFIHWTSHRGQDQNDALIVRTCDRSAEDVCYGTHFGETEPFVAWRRGTNENGEAVMRMESP